jgi:hypothetical protein
MKTYVLTVSSVFPCTHKRKGEETYFIQKILSALGFEIYWDNFKKNMDKMGIPVPVVSDFDRTTKKLHTILANYELWEKRIKEVQDGKAVLIICCWEKPGGRFIKGNKQVKFCRLDKDSGIGVQALAFTIDNSADNRPILFDSCKIIDWNELAKNDGLSIEDFKDWFSKYDLLEPLAIIHFTSFRY